MFTFFYCKNFIIKKMHNTLIRNIITFFFKCVYQNFKKKLSYLIKITVVYKIRYRSYAIAIYMYIYAIYTL